MSLPPEAQEMYDQYDLQISGQIKDTHAWELLEHIEKNYPVDEIKTMDDTRIWNLLRIFLYTFYHEGHTGKRNLNFLSFIVDVPWKSVYHHVFKKYVPIKGDDILRSIMYYVSIQSGLDEQGILNGAYEYVTIFMDMKEKYHRRLLRSHVSEVELECGYGRLPMAHAQACRELGIKCVENQHGIITRYLVAYRRATPTRNYDCVPEYFHAYDKYSAQLVREGGLFKPENVIVKGYPVVDKIVLFTGQWILVEETRQFIKEVMDLLPSDIVLLFKPHPFDDSNYDDLDRLGVVIVDEEDDIQVFLRSVDAHATVYSTSAVDALMLGKPTVFVDLLHLVKPTGCVVDNSNSFVKKVKELI